MIIDLQRFIASERPYWAELEGVLDKLEAEPQWKMPLEKLRHFHYLYERTSAALAKIMTFSAEPEIRRYLEHLVGRAYGEIHETREKQYHFSPWAWFFQTLPRTFRRHARAFWLALAITLTGCLFGGLATAFDPESRSITMSFGHDRLTPSERVAKEEAVTKDRLAGQKGSFSTFLMTHNTHVSILTFALGMTWGIGTFILLFSNGVSLGAIAVDYMMDGQTKFLLGWLMPHGVVEIPAILIAGQAGLMLAGALIGWGRRNTITTRLRAISPDLVTLIFGVAIMLVWAGLIEAFLSQYHEPIIPYWVKISFGSVELVLLILFLSLSGSQPPSARPPELELTHE